MVGSGEEFTAPVGAVEEVLAGVWSQVLCVERVGVEDNFFDLGGDSILSIQVVARARKAGLTLTSRDIFQHQTVASLAAALGGPTASAAPVQDQPPVEGPVVLTPIQRWFFRTHRTAPQHFNMAVHLELAQAVDHTALTRAVEALVAHHDALRLRFERTGAGWRQRNLAEDRTVPVEHHDLSALAPDAWQSALDTITDTMQHGFDLADGPLIRFALIDLGAGGVRLVVVAHHLVVDGVSWRVLLEDLAVAYGQVVSGAAVDLGVKSASFQEWAYRLRELVESGGFDSELAYWSGVGQGVEPGLPVEGVAAQPGGLRVVSNGLSVEATRALLQRVPGVYRTRVNEVLLAVLARVLGEWTGRDRVLVDVEGHGREELFAGVDVSRTVGWFTSVFPLELPAGGDWDVLVKAVKERIRTVPGRGIGHGALRYLGDQDSAAGELGAIRPQVSFNYLGQFDGLTGDGDFYRAMLPSPAGEHSPLDPRSHVLDVVGRVVDGRLLVEWGWQEGVFSVAVIEGLSAGFVAALEEFVAHCGVPGAGGLTPSDFPLSGLDQAGVDLVVGDGRGVEEVLPLSPMQSGMLFHSLVEADSPAYFEQLMFTADGVSDVGGFAASWQRVVDEVQALRVGVVWEGVPEPVQVVRRGVVLPVEVLDWSSVDGDGQAVCWDALVAADRERGLDLRQVPLARLTLVTVAPGRVR
ncbi:condensation domain-containing protein, partial [Kitasatospora sp. NPDC051164]|uniref:condensation domain-containing protein n=1 Tax=Kitasatospora sp. NPDC051164 TaxID=3364055 RepID=UPI0037B774AD